MNFQRFLLILRARYKVALYAMLCTVAVTLVVNLSLPNQYTASASVLVDIKSPDPIAGMVLPALMMPGYMATQVDIINSDRVSRRVVKSLKLDEAPEVRQQWQNATNGKGQLDTWLAERLQKKLNVKPSRVSNVVVIDYVSPDPAFAALAANAYAQAYIDTNIDLVVEPAAQYAHWFGQQGKDLRDRLETAQALLSKYQQNKGIVATDERLDNETARLHELSSQLSVVQGQTVETDSKQRSSGSPETLADVVTNPVIMSLKTDIARLEARRQEMAVNLGRNHPQYQRAEAEVATLKQKMNDEVGRITGSIKTSNHISLSKEGELRAAIEAQKLKLLNIKRQRDELAVLQRDVESAQKAYDAVTQRFTQTNLESKVTQTNISILAAATAPLKSESSSPKILRNIVLAIFLGFWMGIGMALVMERLDRRVRSAGDVERMLGQPILVEIAQQRRPGESMWMRFRHLLGGSPARSSRAT